MTITVEEDGRKRVITNVIDYDVLCTDDVDNTAEMLNITLTEEQKKKVARCCQKAERFPDMEDLADIVKNVASGFYDWG